MTTIAYLYLEPLRETAPDRSQHSALAKFFPNCLM